MDNLSDETTDSSSSRPVTMDSQLCRHNKRSMTAHNLFKFRPLDQTKREIRLLTLQPNAEDDAICVTLEHVGLDEADDTYDAVSYTWGPEMPQHPIWIGEEYLMLRENIWRFLRHSSKNGFKTQRLWIDFICINQADTFEKSGQVSMMSEIFSKASRVYIWLGQASELSPIGTKYALWRSRTDKPYPRIYLSHFLIEEHHGDEVEKDCMRIVFNDYWSRLWVIQEVVLAKEALIILGSDVIELSQIKELDCILPSPHVDIRDPSSALKPWVAYLKGPISYQFGHIGFLTKTRPLLLSDRVEGHSKQLCADVRDRIYGMLGISYSPNPPPVDYACSIQTLFLRTLECFMGEQQDGRWTYLSSVHELARSLGITSDMFRDSDESSAGIASQPLLDRPFNLKIFVDHYIVSCGIRCSDIGRGYGELLAKHFVMSNHPSHDPTETFSFPRTKIESSLLQHPPYTQGVLLYCEFPLQGNERPILLLGSNAEGTLEIHAYLHSQRPPNQQIWLTGQLPPRLKASWESVLNAQIRWDALDDLPPSHEISLCQAVLLPCSAFELLQVAELTTAMLNGASEPREIVCSAENDGIMDL
ncbi:heterokaryon incompatibility protein-domain-containing protein [Paraphoma chrysanthemicola]|nr:heterokaryon incompatibility protein-domain-containing protein [Paraphoma chrysanthemicola]